MYHCMWLLCSSQLAKGHWSGRYYCIAVCDCCASHSQLRDIEKVTITVCGYGASQDIVFCGFSKMVFSVFGVNYNCSVNQFHYLYHYEHHHHIHFMNNVSCLDVIHYVNNASSTALFYCVSDLHCVSYVYSVDAVFYVNNVLCSKTNPLVFGFIVSTMSTVSIIPAILMLIMSTVSVLPVVSMLLIMSIVLIVSILSAVSMLLIMSIVLSVSILSAVSMLLIVSIVPTASMLLIMSIMSPVFDIFPCHLNIVSTTSNALRHVAVSALQRS